MLNVHVHLWPKISRSFAYVLLTPRCPEKGTSARLRDEDQQVQQVVTLGLALDGYQGTKYDTRVYWDRDSTAQWYVKGFWLPCYSLVILPTVNKLLCLPELSLYVGVRVDEQFGFPVG